MSGLRRGVKGRVAWAVLLSLLVVTITLVSAGVALADRWNDISDAQWQSRYGVTASQAATVAGGFQDGSFHPNEAVKRGQFAKMVVDGFGIAYYTPSVATFSDVIKSNTFFKYIEGGVKVGVISGYTDGTYKPNNTVSRQQANKILGTYLSDKEIAQTGKITGTRSTYTTLSGWYAAEGALILAVFRDATNVAAVHAPATAYLVYREVVKGSNGYLTPGTTLTRAQAVALIIRVREATFGGGSGALPAITKLEPGAGAATGGNAVVITGTNFTGATAVKFGDANAVYTVNSATQITATAPAGIAGTSVDVTVTTAGGTSVTTMLTTKYSYGPPVITELEPNGGSALGGTSVTITGTGFTGVTYVKFGNTAAKSYVVLSPTQITAISPAGTTATTVDVAVNTPAGTSAFGPATKFTYGVPTITAINPAAGSAAGGNTVVITGTGFSEITGPTGVKFGTVNATSYTVNSTTQITAVAPAGASGSTVDITVTNSVGTSGTALATKYSYGSPTVTLLTPNAGPQTGGNSVSITGTGFTGATAVKFGGVNATSFSVTTASATSPYISTITAVAPAGTAGTTVDVTVTTPAGTSATSTASKYSYGIPTVTALNPAAGPNSGGTSVVITGTNFVGIIGANGVVFGNKPASSYTVNSATQITAIAPLPAAGGSTVDVVVSNAAGPSTTSLASKYSYGPPTVTDLEAAAGPAGGANSVVIKGTGFTGVTSVKFGEATVGFVVNTEKQITATAPAGALDTTVEVTVITPAGTSALNASTKYRYITLPTVTGLDPLTGPAEGGNQVTITGTYFVEITSVKFGTKTVSASDITIVSDTEMKVKVPSGTSGSVVNVIVTNPVGQSLNTSADDYSYGIPTVAGLSPAAGSNAGGNTVIITGSAFVNVTKVGFYYLDDQGTPRHGRRHDCEYLAASYTVNSQTQITAIAPDGPNYKTVDIRVTNTTGVSATSDASKYSFGAPTITDLNPSGGPLAGGSANKVVITGSGFTGLEGAVAVKFGSDSALAYVVDSPTQITATPPAHATSEVVRVSVTNPVGTSGDSAADDYTYGGPSVTSVSPAAGPATGLNSVIITGSGFSGVGTHPGDAVKFGGANASSYIVDSNTRITAIAPVGTDGSTVQVKVTNNGLTSPDTPADDYSFGAPSVTVLNPTGGPLGGGNQVVLKGSGFSGVTAVKFGAATVSSSKYTIDSPEQITVSQAPTATSAGVAAGGAVYVTVTTPAGTSATGAGNQYIYGVPTITLLNPVAGSTSGGNNVVITGTNFVSVTEVKFGSTDATSYTVNSATQITAKAPAHVAGTVRVKVTTTSGVTPDSVADDYTFGVPTITGLNPSGGSPSGGNLVVIQGDGFTGVTGVKFGTTVVTIGNYTVDSPTQITAKAPAGTGTVDVTVTNIIGTSLANADSKYSYGLPTVTSVSPVAGALGGGNLVTIVGTNFNGVSDVKFGTVSCGTIDVHFHVLSSTQISAIAPVPLVQGTIDVTVTNGAGTSVVSDLTASTTDSSKYSYGVPVVSGLSPNNGTPAGGNTVVISGTGFTGVSGASAVKFGGNNATSYTVNSPTQITAVAPAAASPGTTVNVTVTNLVGTSDTSGAGDDYGYGVPTVTLLSPAAGVDTGGNQVVITGTNFPTTGAVPDVTFGGVPGGGVVVDASTQIRVTAPGGTLNTTVDVVVQTSVGSSATSAASKYSYGAPTVTNINPAAGLVGGGNTVVITGTGFTGVTSIKFGSEALTAGEYTINGPTQITVTDVPSQSQAGTTLGNDVEVTVTNPVGASSATGTYNNYTYGVPVVSTVSPAAGGAGGGNVVTITGKGFLPVTSSGVRFGSAYATGVTVNSATQITATVPAGTLYSTVDVYVTNPAGTSLSSDLTPDTSDTSKYSYGKPRVLGLSPAAGISSGGNTVTITGSGFTGVTAVQFGSVNATGYVVNSPTQITATVPGGTIYTSVDVTVTTSAGTNDISYEGKYSYGVPQVTSLNPTSGSHSGGTIVHIYGTGFTGVTAVKFGSTSALDFTVVSETEIVATAPPGTTGHTVYVRVTNPVGDSSAAPANQYEYMEY